MVGRKLSIILNLFESDNCLNTVHKKCKIRLKKGVAIYFNATLFIFNYYQNSCAIFSTAKIISFSVLSFEKEKRTEFFTSSSVKLNDCKTCELPIV